ncbi:MAG: hypothetical protein HQL68_06640 [Magnetococcales bacterium]|nr:hypothetical protein [Magnetococcales bacterium]
MIVIKVEVWPSGDEHQKREISRANIWNISADKDADIQDYQYAIVEPDSFDGNSVRQGKVLHHNWKQSAWELIRKMIK